MKRLLVVVGLAACSPGGVVDVADRSPDIVRPRGSGDGPEGYEYVVKKPHGTLALAEARGLDPAVARRACDSLAEGMEACLAGLEKKGPLPAGAVRIVAAVDGAGAVGPPIVRVSAGGDAKVAALLCLVAPARRLVFPVAGDAGARGLAVEAAWPP